MSPDGHQWRDEIALREASLADARRERDAGELSAEEFEAIEAREQRALARARAALEAFELTEPARPATRRRRRSLLLVAFFAFLAALAILLVATLTIRQPGNSDTGSVSLNKSQQISQWLDRAELYTADNKESRALEDYQRVIELDPTNVTALTEAGWLEFSAGSEAHDAASVGAGVSSLRKAITVAPTLAAPRLYYAIAAASTSGNHALAVREFRVFLTLKPSPAQLEVAAPFLAQLGLG